MSDEMKKEVPVAGQVGTSATEAAKKKTKKLQKGIVGNVLTITESITGSVLTFDAGKLPAAIQANLMPYGLSQKLGDAAAGKEGKEAVDSINKVWEGLVKGDWSVRAPAAEKIDKKGILDRFNAITDPKQKAMAEAMLIQFGILPAKK